MTHTEDRINAKGYLLNGSFVSKEVYEEFNKLDEWIDWCKFTPPDDVKGLFIKYADGSVFSDSYNSDGTRRHKRDSPLFWKFMDRRDFSEKTMQAILKK